MLEKAVIEAKTFSRLGLAFLAYLLPVLIFARLAVEAVEQSPPRLDIRILEWLHQFSHPVLIHINLFITDVGSPLVVIVASIVIAVALNSAKQKKAAFVLLAGVGGAAVMSIIFKVTFQRVRPQLWIPAVTEPSFAFPSAHAMISSALAFTFIYLLWRTRWRWPAIILGLLFTFVVGMTRLYLGLHFPTDVIAGWVLGFVWVIIMRGVLRWSHQSA